MIAEHKGKKKAVIQCRKKVGGDEGAVKNTVSCQKKNRQKGTLSLGETRSRLTGHLFWFMDRTFG